jgi:hypothetical protein
LLSRPQLGRIRLTISKLVATSRLMGAFDTFLLTHDTFYD